MRTLVIRLTVPDRHTAAKHLREIAALYVERLSENDAAQPLDIMGARGPVGRAVWEEDSHWSDEK